MRRNIILLAAWVAILLVIVRGALAYRTFNWLLPGADPSSEHASLFWLTFWATLIPTLAVGVLGSLAVGWAIWKLQEKAADTRRREDARLELAALRGEIHVQMRHAASRDYEAAIGIVGTRYRDVAASLDPRKLYLWSNIIGDEKGDLLTAAKAFHAAYTEVKLSAIKIDRFLDVEITVLNPPQQNSLLFGQQLLMERYARFLMGPLTADQSTPLLLKHLLGVPDMFVKPLEHFWENAMKSSDFSKVVKQFQDTIHTADVAYGHLKTQVERTVAAEQGAV